MSPDPTHPPADLDAEQEVDFSRYWRLIAARWWLPVAVLIAGLVIGYVVSLGTSGTTYEAKAQVYLGQPFAPGSSEPVTSAATTLGLVTNLITSAATIRSVAARVGLKPARLSRGITTEPVLGSKTSTGPPSLMTITVTGAPPKKIAAAANRLAAIVIDFVSGYTDLKIGKLKERLTLDAKRIASYNDRLAIAQRQQAQIFADKTLAATERLLLLANINTTLTFVESRLSNLEPARLSEQQFLSLAEDVEHARVISPAVATKAAGPSSRTGAAIGGLIGLIVGILAALLWDPVAARVRHDSQV
jgi:uncharacterized protein involved in exopolysaccharide biosynthesis